MRQYTLLLFFIWALLCHQAIAQPSLVESLGATEGLSQGMVHAMLQDRQGLLWFATRDGLNRYDGYHFEVFQNDPFDPFSLADNVTVALLEDRHGRIWVGTENNGLSILDPESGRFYHLGMGPGQLSHQLVLSMSETPDGAVWVGTPQGANRVLLPEKLPREQPRLADIARIETFFWDGVDTPGFPPSNQVPTLLAERNGRYLWCITSLRGFRLDLQTGQQQDFFHCPKGNQSGCSLNTLSLCQTPDGALWATQTDQFYRVQPDQNSIRALSYPADFGQRHKTVLIYADAKGNLIFSTLGAVMMLPAEAIAHGRLPLPTDFVPLPEIGNKSAYAASIMVDQEGLIWLGTNGYGLRKIKRKQTQFAHFLPGVSLRSIRADGQGRVFFWNWIEQIRSLELATGRVSAPILPVEKYWVYDCLPARNGSYWLLCRERGAQNGDGYFVRINANTLQAESFFSANLNFDQFSQLTEDPSGKLWANGSGSQLACLDPQLGKVQVFDFQKTTGFNENSYSPRFDATAQLWLGTAHGLLRAKITDSSSKEIDFTLFKNNPADRHTLASNFVLCTLDDPEMPGAQMWVGTKGGGLHLLDKNTGRVLRHYTTADGLPNNVVYGILADKQGALWISTNSGICRMNPQSVHFKNFSEADGLQSDEFNTISFTTDPAQNLLFFGGVNGLTAFNPAHFSAQDKTPAVRITGLKVQNRSVRPGDGILDKSLGATQQIILPYSKNQLSFEFAAMDFTTPKKNQYRYRLLGAHGEWTESTTSNSATYANLAPGKYVFEVLTGGSQGVWEGTAARLEIKILPPWWRTVWAYLGYFLLALGIAWQLYQVQARRLRLQTERDFERREAQRLAEINAMKSRFFSNVTHEFRTPLTLILEPVRQILADKKFSSVHRSLQLVENNAQRLLRYVNQLLDLGKIENRSMNLDLRYGDISVTLKNTLDEFSPLAQTRNISLSFLDSKTTSAHFFDAASVEQIVQNLVSNALKFTPEGGRVQLRLDEILPSTGNDEPKFILTVSDTGKGIAPEDLPHIFDRYFQATPEHEQKASNKGTGIGLSLAKELTEMMGGTLTAKSESGNGAVFTVCIPMYDAAPTPNIASPALPLPNSPTRSNSISPIQVLLVEDNAELRQFIRQSLPQNWQVTEAADGQEGIEKALEHLPDIVISDVKMPGKDGLELIEGLKNDFRSSHIPIILLTAKSAVESRLAALKRGADAYLTKPFHTEELIAQAENLVVSRQKLRDVFSKNGTDLSVRESVSALQEPLENDFLQKLIEVIERNMDNQDASVDDYARDMFMSRSQLYRKMTALTGQSVSDFARNHRLDLSREMLLKNVDSVRDVALRTGFANVKYFSTVFRERFGVSPSSLVPNATDRSPSPLDM